jgi:hypothetical protein
MKRRAARVITVLFVILWSAIAGAQAPEQRPRPILAHKPLVQLKPPSPGARKPSGPQESQSYAGQQPTASDHRGTDQVPLTVKVLPTPKSQAEISEEQRRADEHAANERGLTTATWVLAGFTLLLAFIAAGQIALFFWQLRLMRQGIDDAKEAADAATKAATAASLHATAVVRSEMPVVRLHRLQMKDHATGAIVHTGAPPQHCDISVTFMNHGRTTAFPVQLSLGHDIKRDLPEYPIYIRIINFEAGSIIRPDREFRIKPDHSVWMTNEAYRPFAEMIVQRQAEFWFFGMLEFEDFLGTPGVWRFCARWVPFLPPVPGESQEQPRTPHGGFVVGGPANYREHRGDPPAWLGPTHSGFLLPISPPD